MVTGPLNTGLSLIDVPVILPEMFKSPELSFRSETLSRCDFKSSVAWALIWVPIPPSGSDSVSVWLDKSKSLRLKCSRSSAMLSAAESLMDSVNLSSGFSRMNLRLTAIGLAKPSWPVSRSRALTRIWLPAF